jgi:hypothetical protein
MSYMGAQEVEQEGDPHRGETFSSRFRPGVDLHKLFQLIDETKAREAVEKARRVLTGA